MTVYGFIICHFPSTEIIPCTIVLSQLSIAHFHNARRFSVAEVEHDALRTCFQVIDSMEYKLEVTAEGSDLHVGGWIVELVVGAHV